MKAYALLLAGGRGSRMGTGIPKQFLPLCGVPVILRTLSAFADCDAIDGICLVCHPDFRAEMENLLAAAGISKPITLADGGADRRQSVFSGLRAMERECPEDAAVLIHDAARPLVSQEVIRRCIRTVERYGAANTVYPSENTMILSPDGAYAAQHPPRESCYTVQTPQGFVIKEILAAHRAYENLAEPFPVTDDCGLYAAMTGRQPRLCLGEKGNIKITTRLDLYFAQAILQAGTAGRDEKQGEDD